MTKNQPPRLNWRNDEIPVSVHFDDPYFSLEGGLAETRHVFLAGNALPERFKDGFHIAELGFGTGLNMFTTLLSWRAAGLKTRLKFTSFEAYPLTAQDMEKALSAFPEARAIADPILNAWAKGETQIMLEDLDLTVVIGDARTTLPDWDHMADAWFLDGFSPAKNPELWEDPLLQSVGDHTCAGGTFATYTAAGFVRKGLTNAGFTVTREKGFGRKRHMSTGVKL
ncbi:MAG: tRNA (5-methylaminomethyl-2-thiouridine)(34)-methyltransferase MnmD [Halocynthiibacter sp.]